MVGLEFLSGVLIGLLAGFSIQKRWMLTKFAMMEQAGMLKLCKSEDVAPLAEKFFKEQMEAVERKWGSKHKDTKPSEDEEKKDDLEG